MPTPKSPFSGGSLIKLPTAGPRAMLSITEVEYESNLSHTKIYEEIRSGRLKTMKCGRRRLVTQEQFAEWQKALIQATPNAGGAHDDQQ